MAKKPRSDQAERGVSRRVRATALVLAAKSRARQVGSITRVSANLKFGAPVHRQPEAPVERQLAWPAILLPFDKHQRTFPRRFGAAPPTLGCGFGLRYRFEPGIPVADTCRIWRCRPAARQYAGKSRIYGAGGTLGKISALKSFRIRNV